MKKYIPLFLLAALPVSASSLNDAIRGGLEAKADMEALTDESIPDEYRLRVVNEDSDKLRAKVFYRGDRKIMQIVWSIDWTGEKEKMYSGTIFDGDTPVCRFVHLTGDKVNILPVKKAAAEYAVWVGIGDAGGGTIDIMKNDELFESYIVDGRSTRPVDGLTYAKNVMSIERIAKPLSNAIKDMKKEK